MSILYIYIRVYIYIDIFYVCIYAYFRVNLNNVERLRFKAYPEIIVRFTFAARLAKHCWPPPASTWRSMVLITYLVTVVITQLYEG